MCQIIFGQQIQLLHIRKNRMQVIYHIHVNLFNTSQSYFNFFGYDFYWRAKLKILCSGSADSQKSVIQVDFCLSFKISYVALELHSELYFKNNCQCLVKKIFESSLKTISPSRQWSPNLYQNKFECQKIGITS